MQKIPCVLGAAALFSLSCYAVPDLSLESCTVPVKGYVNNALTITAVLENKDVASVNSADYEFILFVDGEEVMRRAGDYVPPLGRRVSAVSYTPGLASPDSVTLTLRVEYPQDHNPYNNIWQSDRVRLLRPVYPRPKEVNARAFNGLTVHWSAPDVNEIPPQSSVEDFEDCTPFSDTDLAGFTSVDRDGLPTLRLEPDVEWGDWDDNGQAMGWRAFDPSYAGLGSPEWMPFSGSQCLVSVQATVGNSVDVACDDWLISPELHPDVRDLSFFARSASQSSEPERFDVMVSMTDNKVESFEPVAQGVAVYCNNGWREFEYVLPEGAKYFAIVHRTIGGTALLVDEVTYTPVTANRPYLVLRNYNVYRDGVCVTKEPVNDMVFVDHGIDVNKEYTYQVTAIWNLGESDYSDSVTISAAASVDDVAADALDVSVHDGHLVVSGPSGTPVEIYTIDGVAVASVTLDGSVFELGVAPGVYVVKAGDNATRLLVR